VTELNLLQKITDKQNELKDLSKKVQNYSDPKMVNVSQELDGLIIEYQNIIKFENKI
jgi:Spo0E like sporulation regulatory protein